MVPSDRTASMRFSKSVGLSGNNAIVGAHRVATDANGMNELPKAGAAYVFGKGPDGFWSETAKLVASDRNAEDNFGTSVAIDGDFAIVGAYKRDETINGVFLRQCGAAYIFKRNSAGEWQEVQKLLASDPDSLDYFGVSVDISGNYALVGASYKQAEALPQAGAVYVFEKQPDGHWAEVDKLLAEDKNAFDLFGWSVSLDGTQALIGAYNQDKNETGGDLKINAGAAYIFEKSNGGNWEQQQKIVAGDRNANDLFGFDVCMGENTLVVGAYQCSTDEFGDENIPNAGAAYIFEKNALGQWEEVKKITAPYRAAEDNFGYSVAISGENLVVGAYHEDEDEQEMNTLSSAGAAYSFTKANGSWSFYQKLVPADRNTGDWFGFSLAMDGAFALIGAFADRDDENSQNPLAEAGSAYFFKNESLTPAHDRDGRQQINVYPNPVVSELHVDGVDQPGSLEIYDTFGRLEKEFNLKKSSQVVDVRELNPGCHVVRFVLQGNFPPVLIYKL